MTTDNFLVDFRETIETATTRLNAIPAELSSREPAPGKWTQRQILGHLIDSAANNHHRFVKAQFTDNLVFAGYQQDDWVSAQHYNDESWSDLIQLWSAYNRHLLHAISVIPEEVMTRQRLEHNLDQIAFNTVPTSEPCTLEYFVHDYVEHMRHHLDEIFSTT